MTKRFLAWVLLPLLCWAGCAGSSRFRQTAVQEPARGIYHEVQKGETLWHIGQSYQVSVDEIISVNKLSNPSQLLPGQLLFIPTVSIQPRTPPAAPLPPPPVARKSSSHSGPVQFGWPVRGKVISHFGQATPLGRNRGVNISGKEGSPILASAPGVVSFAGEKVKGFGKTVILDHGGQFQTIYTHNQELLVKTGESVQGQQPIARLGKSGRAHTPMLHFEIRQGNRPLNPMNYLQR